MPTNTCADKVPSVSVVIPCFRAGIYLRKSVLSALSQSGHNYCLTEVIIADDGSDDSATLNVYAEICKLQKVIIIKNSGKKGSAGARNSAIKIAKGDWIAFLDADDWWPSDSLSKRFRVLESYPDAEWIGGDFLELNRDGGFEEHGRFARNITNYPFLSPAYTGRHHCIQIKHPLHTFLMQAPTHTIVSLVKKSLLNSGTLFNEDLLRQQDIHLFLRLANKTDFHYTPEIVAFYRYHETNSTKSLSHTQEWRILALEDLKKLPEFKSTSKLLLEQIYNLHLSNSYEYRQAREFKKAQTSSKHAVRVKPGSLSAWKSLFASYTNKE